MILSFTKYHGTGNDFIMIDSTKNADFSLSNEQISFLCDRRFGIGADGVIIIFRHKEYDFEMRYHNADGSMSFCGNGARCAVKFAQSLALFDSTARFIAIDGEHLATLDGDLISLKMNDVKNYSLNEDHYVIDTGSPHYIQFTKDLAKEDIVKFGKEVRYSPTYKTVGINVNLVEVSSDNKLKMLTYERGVEDETYSCGTGATAVALAYGDTMNLTKINVDIQVKGGMLKVKALRKGKDFEAIYLIGPAVAVFQGEIQLPA